MSCEKLVFIQWLCPFWLSVALLGKNSKELPEVKIMSYLFAVPGFFGTITSFLLMPWKWFWTSVVVRSEPVRQRVTCRRIEKIVFQNFG